MVFIPIWISNVLLLVACAFSAYQHWQLNRENPITTFQTGVIVFSMIMIVVATIYVRHHRDPWISLLFVAIAAATLFLTYRQFRMLPPRRTFE